MTLLYTDPSILEHHTGAHPERAERIRSIQRRLAASGLIDACSPGEHTPIDPKVVAKVHSPEVVATIEALAEQGGGRADPDTMVSPRSYDIALTIGGIGVSAVDAILAGRDSNAFCLIRPPGHHATPTRSMGFCLFNTIALAAHHALETHGLERVLIVDWDVHHGNGTQDIFFDEERVFFLSVHRYERGFYPGTGSASETGTGSGLGWTANVALTMGISRSDYLDEYRRALAAAAEKTRPQLVLLSAGFDAHADDPIGSLGLAVDDFVPLTKEVLDVAEEYCEGKVVSFLEGGYNVDRLADCVEVHLRALLEHNEPKA